MDHVAIMRKSWGLLPKILSSKKTIESRWYKSKYQPWDRIKAQDTIYFKNSGEPISIKAEVFKVLQFSNLTPKTVRKILNEYGREDGIEKNEISKYFQMFKDKKYCLLIFFKDVQSIKPFQINKSSFGTMAAWITIENIKEIKL